MVFLNILMSGIISCGVLVATEFHIPDCWGRADDNGVNEAFRIIESGVRQNSDAQNLLSGRIIQLRLLDNHFLYSLELGINRDVAGSEHHMAVVDGIYDNLEVIPGHFNRHHRSFRDALRNRFESIDQMLRDFESKQNGETQLNNSRFENLTNQTQTLFQRVQVMESGMITLKEENKVLKAEIEILKCRNFESNNRAPSPRGRR